MSKTVILGAGVTGLSAAYQRRRTVYEAQVSSGGICASYYVVGNGQDTARSYRFEKGGGHWIFGQDEQLLGAIKKLSPFKRYKRRSAVYFPDLDSYVPYPLQNNLSYLPKKFQKRIFDEISAPRTQGNLITLQEWLLYHFGPTLGELFFFPFHDLYTAGLTAKIAPQDSFKSPVFPSAPYGDFTKKRSIPEYNASFIYPKEGLDHLIRKFEMQCDVRYNKKAVRIDVKNKRVLFEDASEVLYGTLISTIPLSKVLSLCNFNGPSDPYTSVLVLNIGAQKGIKCPKDHWVYVPHSKSGFHRIGFYSNVDTSFLPDVKERKELVSIYVEKAYLPEDKPSKLELEGVIARIVAELKSWKYIKDVEVVSPTWIDFAYTWQVPGSTWRENALSSLKAQGIHSLGRYGAWRFQGILDSMKEGFSS